VPIDELYEFYASAGNIRMEKGRAYGVIVGNLT
jgi:hypothetical protein